MPELGGSYFTFANENNYMIWTFLKKCWQNGWLYRGADVMPWCPRCATAISQHEIVTDGYAELTHQSVTLRFPLRGPEGRRTDPQTGLPEALLVWTTTPWTLTSNVAAAVGANLTYAKVRQEDEVFYLAKGTLPMLKGRYELLGELKGAEMEGWTYSGPFDDLPAAQNPGGFTEIKEMANNSQESAAQAHRVILWSEVGRDGRHGHRAHCAGLRRGGLSTRDVSLACRCWRHWKRKGTSSKVVLAGWKGCTSPRWPSRSSPTWRRRGCCTG